MIHYSIDNFEEFASYNYICFDGTNFIFKQKIIENSSKTKPLIKNIRWELMGGLIFKKIKNEWMAIGTIDKTGKIKYSNNRMGLATFNTYIEKNLNIFERKLKLEKLLKS